MKAKVKRTGEEKKALRKRIRQYKIQYLFLVPAFVAVILFSYIPMAGVVMSFMDYDILKGPFRSPWVGFEHFQEFRNFGRR